MPTLEDAIALAAQAHRGQKGRAGEPYILHPLRVMLQFSEEPLQIIGILHDVVEDTGITLDELRARGFSEEIVSAVDHLSRRSGESYEDFVERIRPNALARRVKLADLEDNMDARRLPTFGQKDGERMQRYHRAWITLTRDEAEGGNECLPCPNNSKGETNR